MKIYPILGILISMSTFHGAIYAQNTPPPLPVLSITIQQADSLFLTKNLSLMAARFGIQMQKAMEVQAKLFPNPNLQLTKSAFSTTNQSGLLFGNSSEMTASISQLIQLAGKRNKNFKIAEATTRLTEWQFTDLLKSLKFALHSDFYTIFYLKKSKEAYVSELKSLNELVNSFNTQQNIGNISLKDNLRIKAQLYSLQSEAADLDNQIRDARTELGILLKITDSTIFPTLNQDVVDGLDPNVYSIQTILDSAHNNLPSLKIAGLNTQISQLNYHYQRALATPDLNLSLNYDQRANVVPQFFSLGVSMDLPFFNRNQGNIKAAKITTQMSVLTEQNVALTTKQTLENAFQKTIEYNNLFHSRDKQFDADFQKMQQMTLKTYQLHNISLLDFLDFFESYKQNTVQLNELQINRLNAFEALNYYSGYDFFKTY